MINQIKQRMDRFDDRVNQQYQVAQDNMTKNHLRMEDRSRELDAIRDDYHHNVKKNDKDVENEI